MPDRRSRSGETRRRIAGHGLFRRRAARARVARGAARGVARARRWFQAWRLRCWDLVWSAPKAHHASGRGEIMKPLATASAVLLLAAGAAGAQTLDELKNDGQFNDATRTDNVLTYGMGYHQQRYSPLNQINS